MNIFSRRIWWRQWCKKHSTDTSYTKVVFHSWILNSRIELGPRANYFNLQCHASQKRQDSYTIIQQLKMRFVCPVCLYEYIDPVYWSTKRVLRLGSVIRESGGEEE